MPNQITQFPLIVDQQLLQTLRMGITALQVLAQEAEVRLNLAVQAALLQAEEHPAHTNGQHFNGHAEAL